MDSLQGFLGDCISVNLVLLKKKNHADLSTNSFSYLLSVAVKNYHWTFYRSGTTGSSWIETWNK